MYGFCEEIEIAKEFETCKEINAKWPHLVEAHIDSLHPDIREAVGGRWHRHKHSQRAAYEIEAQMSQAQQAMLFDELRRREMNYGGRPVPQPFSLTGLHLGLGL